MREILAKTLAALTGVIVIALAAAFSLAQNAPGGRDTQPRRPVAEEASSRTQPPAAGRTAYDANGCAGCHAIGGQGNPRSPLDGVGARLKPDEIRDWIIASEKVRPRLTAGVARIKQTYAELPEEELRLLVDYLAGLRASAAGKQGLRESP